MPTEQIKVFVEKAAKKTNAEIQISKKSAIPENEYAVITVDPNRLYAKLRLYPNSSLGSRLTVEDILKLLEQHDVSYGIIRKNIAFCSMGNKRVTILKSCIKCAFTVRMSW